MSEVLLNKILEEISSMKEDMSSLKSDMSSLKSDMSSLKSDVSSLKSDVSSLKSDVSSIKETQKLMQIQLQETNQIVQAIRDRQEETDAKLDALSMDVNKLQGVVTTHDEKLIETTNEQLHQQQIIDTLSLRSIQHESDLRLLKQTIS